MSKVQHELEHESDDDGEVYFLKPVNEYNIGDKIKEANKELFSDEVATDIELMTDSQRSRKVSFAANLEEYAPQNGINTKELGELLGMYCIENNEKNLQINENDQKLEIIAEEETVSETEVEEACENYPEVMENEKAESSKHVKDIIAEDDLIKVQQNELKSTRHENEQENIMMEEICEEILIMDMESDKANVANVTKPDSPGGFHRKISKQVTFDYTEDDDEIDNKSLTNLLISDNENDSNSDEVGSQEYNCNESLSGDTDTEDKMLLTNTEDYYDDDDKLSIIVASYLPEDLACDKTILTPLSVKSSPRPSNPRKLPFSKRFSFRRKAKSSNAINSCSNHLFSNNSRFMPPPEVTDLKLRYKHCCEFKNTQQMLPKYTGYLSEYGLSKEQLIDHECKLQQKRQVKAVEISKTSEKEGRKMHDNERAFTTWLRNKMRYPINKTRNMFDVKRPFGLRKCTSLGGNTLSDDTMQIFNTTKYRSISAKLKKA